MRARVERGGERRSGRHVRLERRAREAAAHAPAADRPDARDHRVLQVVGGGVLAALRDRDQLVERRRRLRDPRLGRPAAAHADDHGVGAELAQQRRPVAGHGRLAGALAGGDHGELRPVELDRLVARRLEPRAGRLVGEPEAQRERGQPQLARRGHDRLVGEVDDRVGARREPPQPLLHVGLDRHAVVLLERAGPELLLAAAEHDPGQVEPGQRVADGGRDGAPRR